MFVVFQLKAEKEKCFHLKDLIEKERDKALRLVCKFFDKFDKSA